MADTALAGDLVQASVASFPAATTTVMPSATARSTASLSAISNPPPKLKFATAGWPATWC